MTPLEAAVAAYVDSGWSTKHDNMRESIRAYLDAVDPDALAVSWESAAGIQHVLAIIRPEGTP